jgi:hypothetical protein
MPVAAQRGPVVQLLLSHVSSESVVSEEGRCDSEAKRFGATALVGGGLSRRAKGGGPVRVRVRLLRRVRRSFDLSAI